MDFRTERLAIELEPGRYALTPEPSWNPTHGYCVGEGSTTKPDHAYCFKLFPKASRERVFCRWKDALWWDWDLKSHLHLNPRFVLIRMDIKYDVSAL